MGLSYVEDVHLELHDNILQDVHFVAETAFVKGIVSVECSGLELLVLITYPVRVVSSRAHKGGGGCETPQVFSSNYSF